jgi:hypothetical protein
VSVLIKGENTGCLLYELEDDEDELLELDDELWLLDDDDDELEEDDDELDDDELLLLETDNEDNAELDEVVLQSFPDHPG